MNQTSYDETTVEIDAVGSAGSVDLGEVVVELVVVDGLAGGAATGGRGLVPPVTAEG